MQSEPTEQRGRIVGGQGMPRGGSSPTVLLEVLKPKLAEALLGERGYRHCNNVRVITETNATITAKRCSMVHRAVRDDVVLQGQWGGGTAVVLQSNGGANRSSGFEGGGSTKPAP